MRILNNTPGIQFSSSQGIMNRTDLGFFRLLPSPFFSGSHRAEDVSGGCILGKQPPSFCPSTFPRGQDQGIAWAYVEDEDTVY